MNLIISPLRKVIAFSALTLALAGSSLVALANDHDPIGSPKGSASTAEVKYVGGKTGEFMFNVVYDNTAGSRFGLKVLDAEGNLLYQNFYTDKKFDRKFKINDAEGKLTFVIKNYQDNSTQSFEVNSNTRMVEDIEVKEVK
jgi:hypothetical protein